MILVHIVCNIGHKSRPLGKSAYPKKLFSDFSAKTYVVSTQMNRLNEMVLLSIQNMLKLIG